MPPLSGHATAASMNSPTWSINPWRRFIDQRAIEIGIGSQILRDLGITEMVLLTNQPQSRYVGLEGYGLKIVGTRQID